MRAGVPSLPVVRLYESLRTAHLERARQLAPASIVHREVRYDYDAALADGLDLVRAGRVGGAVSIARSGVRVLEVNEPLMTSSLPATALTLAALALRGRGRRVEVVSYAIGNADPFGADTAPTWRTRLRRRGERVLARAVWSRLDRVVFGTDAARRTYADVLGRPAARTVASTVHALPAPHPGAGGGVRPPVVAFVGALVERKGVRVLLEAWPLVTARRPEARLVVLGKGPLEDAVRSALVADPTGSYELDPSRDRIHEVLDGARVLTLPSQPSPTWREQVGLPVVEGLSHGCTVVTTTETGLADWLVDHGHVVVPDAGAAEALADGLVVALDLARTSDEVLADLPTRDGRLAADDVLVAGAVQ
jgi:glycosyltransferase involved in cell wall biosynthesis